MTQRSKAWRETQSASPLLPRSETSFKREEFIIMASLRLIRGKQHKGMEHSPVIWRF